MPHFLSDALRASYSGSSVLHESGPCLGRHLFVIRTQWPDHLSWCLIIKAFNAGCFSLSENTCVWALVFPFDVKYVKYSSEAALVVAVQGQQMSAISHPGLTAVQKSGDTYATLN